MNRQGGSYIRENGKLRLVERTQPAKQKTEQAAEKPAPAEQPTKAKG